jgi:hypothetical protein
MDTEQKTRTRLCMDTAMKLQPEDRPFKPFASIAFSSLANATPVK